MTENNANTPTPRLKPAPRRQPTALASGFAAAASTIRWLTLLLVALFAASGITFVEPGEVALVLRLGRLTGVTPAERVHQPGLLLALPYPIDEVIRVPVKREGELIIEDLWKALSEPSGTDSINPLKEGYLLTGDQNLIQTRLTVKYRIEDPVAFHFASFEPERVLRDVVTSSLSRVASSWNVDEVLRQQRSIDDAADDGGVLASSSLSQAAMRIAQQNLEALRTGLKISALEFTEMHPPRHVVAEFQRVQSEKIAIETLKREAEGFAAREIPQAQAERTRLISQALAFTNALTANAQSEASVFEQLVGQHRINPRLVEQRLYQETLEEVFPGIGRIQYVPPDTRLILPDTR
ncbi:MAG: protease modulator HflK [Planctomycetaceae bacterium]|nr:protease modulator HflK [Planctomycetaceae bacterium]